MSNRWKDWLAQAERDLEHVQVDIASGFYEWACFSAQQAAEKTLKAVYLHNNQEGWGHSVAGLLRNLPAAAKAAELNETAARLDHLHPDPLRQWVRRRRTQGLLLQGRRRGSSQTCPCHHQLL
jgi:HEPN domain-containing protein